MFLFPLYRFFFFNLGTDQTDRPGGGGGEVLGIFELQEFFLSRSMNIFRVNWRALIFFHLISLARNG